MLNYVISVQKVRVYALYLLIFLIIIAPLYGLQYYVYPQVPKLGNLFNTLSITPPSNLPKLEIIGFITPLLISIALILYIIKIKRTRIGKTGTLTLFAGIIITTASFFLPLTPINKFGASLNILLVSLVTLNITYHLYKKDYKLALPLAYVLGFLTSAVSDITSTFGSAHFIGTFGGYGLLDGDFLMPLALALAVVIMRKLEMRKEHPI